MRRRWLGCGLGGIVCALAVAWLTFGALSSRRDTGELAGAEREMEVGRYAPARDRLARLASRRPGWAEAEYALGVCEAELGRPHAALAAWSRVSVDSPFARRAALPRARFLILHRGAFAAAEDLLLTVVRDHGPDSDEARGTLARLYLWQGRLAEMRAVLREGWALSPDRAAALRESWLLDTDALPTEAIRDAVAAAEKTTPDDDRAWLARAYLATRSGKLEEAAAGLDACLRRRPNDVPVWHARLDLAVTAGEIVEAWRAMEHLKAAQVSDVEGLALRAWLAGRKGETDAERRTLERLVAVSPGDARALVRLSELAAETGDADGAARYRREKAALDRAKKRYEDLLASRPSLSSYEELARLAETQGRWFEARGWWTLLAAGAPDNPTYGAALARLPTRFNPPAGPPGRTLADLLSDFAPSATAVAGRRKTEQSTESLPSFRDDAKAANLASFVFHNGATPLWQMPETGSGGVGLLDYDGDGWLDVYFVQGGPFPPDPGKPSTGDALYRNKGDGTFEDVTQRAKIAGFARGYGHGVAIGDIDNDGDPDVFVTRWRSYALYRNNGDGTFTDVTAEVGLGGDRDWPTSAAFADLDGDGDLDLYVCHYLVWDASHPTICRDPTTGANVACRPRDFPSCPDHVFRNDGGRFVDVTESAGIIDRDGRGLGVVVADLDGDGKVDIYVTNDTTANFLFRNLGGFRFEEIAHMAGVAANAGGGYQAGMGVACGDLDGDGLPDLAIGNFFDESTSFFRNLGAGFFADRTLTVGLAMPSRNLLSFGISFLDADDDGWLDLLTANGHVSDFRPMVPYAMCAQLLRGGASGRLTDVSGRAGPPFSVPHVSRGLAVGDLDNDGKLDALMIAQNEPPIYFHNRTTGGRSVTLLLEGTASNRDGVGARVSVTSGGLHRVAQRTGGGSYQSSSDPRLHFGLGTGAASVTAEVRWPSGRTDRYEALSPGGGYRLREGDPRPTPLPGFPRPPATGARAG
jgi:predicted Zn-dependent protease